MKGKLLKDFYNEFIINPILNKTKNIKELLLNNVEINDETFSKKFMDFIFLSIFYIDYKINSKEEKNNEFSYILREIIILNKKFEEFTNKKNINYDDFMNYFCEFYFDLLKDVDVMIQKEKLNNFFNNLLKKDYKDQTFYNIETNILTCLTYDKDKYKNKNLRYLSVATNYPNLEELNKYISSYNKPLPILKAFMSIDKKNSDIGKLSHLETINDFINTFAEETSNLISRQTYENETIEYYLNEIRNRSVKDENGKSPLDIQFEKFCNSYEEISNLNSPLKITEALSVMNILNDDKIKNKETPINKLYSHLIEIQNEFLQKIIDDYNNKTGELKEDIIIKNAIEQIQKEIPIQLATKADIFSFNVSNNIILSFEELFSFYSFKDIFNEKNEKIDYSKYSHIKFKLKMIEKDLVNIILTGKKLFSKKQIIYKFYLDPYEIEEKTKKFEKFTKLYGKEELTQNEKIILLKAIENLKKIILPNL